MQSLPQSMPVPRMRLPVPLSTSATDSVGVDAAVKPAVTERLAVIDTTQVELVPEHEPDQPEKTLPLTRRKVGREL